MISYSPGKAEISTCIELSLMLIMDNLLTVFVMYLLQLQNIAYEVESNIRIVN